MMDRKEDLYQQAYDTLRDIIDQLKKMDVFIPEIEIELQSYIKEFVKED